MTIEVLIVCTGNICRSPMAEGMLRQMLADRSTHDCRVRSAGTHAMDGRPAEPHAVEAARERGANINGHRARSLDREMVARADLILVMETGQADLIARVLATARQAQTLHLLADFSPVAGFREVDDPYGRPLEAYRECARLMQACLAGVLEYIENLQMSS